MGQKTTIIFDFDGTIADSYNYVIGFLRREAGRRHTVTAHEKVELRGYSMVRMARALGMPLWRMPFLFLKGRREMAKHIDDVTLFTGIPEIIRELHEAGFQIFIVSANSEANIDHFMLQHNLRSYISAIYGGAGIVGKAPLLRRLLVTHNLRADECWYVGDEARDVRTARRVGMYSVAVTWGYNNASLLHKQHPTAVVFKPDEILQVVSR
jgi:phosphoglycolate phosphatase